MKSESEFECVSRQVIGILECDFFIVGDFPSSGKTSSKGLTSEKSVETHPLGYPKLPMGSWSGLPISEKGGT